MAPSISPQQKFGLIHYLQNLRKVLIGESEVRLSIDTYGDCGQSGLLGLSEYLFLNSLEELGMAHLRYFSLPSHDAVTRMMHDVKVGRNILDICNIVTSCSFHKWWRKIHFSPRYDFKEWKLSVQIQWWPTMMAFLGITFPLLMINKSLEVMKSLRVFMIFADFPILLADSTQTILISFSLNS